MHRDDTHPIDQLLTIIPDHPALRVMHFVDRPTPLIDALADLTRRRDYEYRLLCFDEAQSDTLSRHYALEKRITVQSVTHDQARYHRQAKMYDYLFVEAHIPEVDTFLKKVYTSMKNAAPFFALIHPNQRNQIETWRRAAEENFFVAFNTFDLTDSLHVISAKKMHGWGG
jgi:predicted nucleic acid-binding protein